MSQSIFYQSSSKHFHTVLEKLVIYVSQVTCCLGTEFATNATKNKTYAITYIHTAEKRYLLLLFVHKRNLNNFTYIIDWNV